MRIVKAMFSKTFPIGIYFEKIFLEAELTDQDDVRKCLYDLKRQVENFHFESNKADEKKIEKEKVVEETKLPLTKVVDLIKEINFCKDYSVLEKTHKYIASTDTDLQIAYDKRLEELKQNTIKSIMDATEGIITAKKYQDSLKNKYQ